MAKKKPSTTSQPLPKTNPALERLGILVGEWKVEMSAMLFHPDPAAVVSWRVSFEWLEGMERFPWLFTALFRQIQ